MSPKTDSPGHLTSDCLSEDVILAATRRDKAALDAIHSICRRRAHFCRRKHKLTEDDVYDLGKSVYLDIADAIDRGHLLDQALQGWISRHMAAHLGFRKPLGNTGVTHRHFLADHTVMCAAALHQEALKEVHEVCQFIAALYQKKKDLSDKVTDELAKHALRELILAGDTGQLIVEIVSGLISTHLNRHLSKIHKDRRIHVPLHDHITTPYDADFIHVLEVQDYLVALVATCEPCFRRAIEHLSEKEHVLLAHDSRLHPEIPAHHSDPPTFVSDNARRKALQRARAHLARHLRRELQAELHHGPSEEHRELVETLIGLIDEHRIIRLLRHLDQLLDIYHDEDRAEHDQHGEAA